MGRLFFSFGLATTLEKDTEFKPGVPCLKIYLVICPQQSNWENMYIEKKIVCLLFFNIIFPFNQHLSSILFSSPSSADAMRMGSSLTVYPDDPVLMGRSGSPSHSQNFTWSMTGSYPSHSSDHCKYRNTFLSHQICIWV